MTYSKLMKSMLLTVAVLGLMSVASACEISGYKYERISINPPSLGLHSTKI